MPQDYLGNPISSGDAQARSAIDDFIGGVLGYETRAERIIDAAEGSDDPLTNAYAGLLTMFLESAEAPALATRYLRRSQDALGAAQLPREHTIVQLLRQWIDDDLPATLASCDSLLQQSPRDLFALKLNQYLRFNLGDAPGMLRAALQALPHAREVPQVHGMLAFAYEQCHLLEQAEAAARQALRLQAREPWAQHALAHVLLTEGRIEQGISVLEGASAGWHDLNSFMYTHNWWHLALFHLARGHNAQVLAIYDRHVWGVLPAYSQDQIGAVSLLTRLELAGVDVGERWQQLLPYLRARADDTVQPFLSLHYLYGLARVGAAEAKQLLQALRRRAAQTDDFLHPVWQQIALPAAEGLYAHAQGRYELAADRLDHALPRLVQVGGSHAQRDLFALLSQDAHLRARHWCCTQQLLELRRRYDPLDVPTNRALARVYSALGIEAEAATAARRAGGIPPLTSAT